MDLRFGRNLRENREKVAAWLRARIERLRGDLCRNPAEAGALEPRFREAATALGRLLLNVNPESLQKALESGGGAG